MKKILSNNKVIYSIAFVIIVVGLLVAFTVGFSTELEYDKNESVIIYIGTEFKIEDIEKIAKDTLDGENVVVKFVGEFKDTVSITVEEITDDEKSMLLENINKKFELEITEENIQKLINKEVLLIDILKQYVTPLIIASGIIIIYFMIIYRKNGAIKVACISIISIIVFQVLLFSIIAITRLPIGRITLTLILVAFMLSIVYLIKKFEKVKENLKDK